MLEQNDLKEIRGIMKEEIDDFAITVNKSFQEQREYLDGKFEGIDKRFEGIDKRFEGIDKRFEGIDKKFEGIDKKFEGIDKKFDKIEQELSAIRWELSDIQKRLIGLEVKMERLIKMETEDFSASNKEMEKLKYRVGLLEQQYAPAF